MKNSAGILMYRNRNGLEILLVHPGGPFWKNKDDGSWSIPKGEFSDDENPLNAAKREFYEETGLKPDGNFIALPVVKQNSAKTIYAWAFQGDCDINTIVSNTFMLEWPPKSGKMTEFPEVDRAAWFNPEIAARKIIKGQLPLIDYLVKALNGYITDNHPI